MGNLNNPSINRWGLTLFWYNFWFSDKNSKFSYHQDYFFTKIIYIYFNYGLNLNKNFFFNLYWNSKKSNICHKVSSFIKTFSSLSLRFLEHKNKLDNTTEIFFLRHQRKYNYLSKMWILKYQNWYIFNLYSIQEIKDSFNSSNLDYKLLDNKTNLYNITESKINSKKSIIRLILFFKYYNSNIKNTSLNYFF